MRDSGLKSAGKCLGGLVLVGLATTVSGQTVDTVEQSFAVSGVPEIYVRNDDGRTELRSHDASTVEVCAVKEVERAREQAEAEKLAAEVEVRIEQTGNRVSVQTVYPEARFHFWRDARVVVHIEIRAPERSDLDVEVEDGDLIVQGFEGELELTAEDGNMRVLDCGGRVAASAEDGDVELMGVHGDVSATLEDGDLSVQGTLSRLIADTEDGNMDIEVRQDSAMQGDWSVRAEDGRIRLSLPEGFAADLNVQVDDGSIEIDQPVTIQGRFSNKKLSTQLNGGGHRLEIRSSDGSVRITES